jgi:N-acetylmuramoyl-L-alanine amidase
LRHAPRIHLTTGVPAALAGTIALGLFAAPAHAAPSSGAAALVDRDAATAGTSRDAMSFGQATAVRTLSAAPAVYTVREGDTVSAIARRFGLNTGDVLAWNGLGWTSLIRPGQVLRLTAPTAAAAAPAPTAGTYDVRPGDTLWAIARRAGTTVAAVMAANGLSAGSIIYPGQHLTVPGASSVSRAASTSPAPTGAVAYVVVAGDTVTAIARRHGVSIDTVLAANGLSRTSVIHPGQRLTVPAPSRGPAGAPSDAPAQLDAEQMANARHIIDVGRRLGVPDRGIEIALGAAMQESWLRNLDWGQDDSLGLFQQRPSAGWGTPAQILDADRAIRVFYGGPGDPNGAATRGLLDIPGWQSMSFAQAAQAVQVSAYPDRYAQWERDAAGWLATLG